jgi:hypothetical protein
MEKASFPCLQHTTDKHEYQGNYIVTISKSIFAVSLLLGVAAFVWKGNDSHRNTNKN